MSNKTWPLILLLTTSVFVRAQSTDSSIEVQNAELKIQEFVSDTIAKYHSDEYTTVGIFCSNLKANEFPLLIAELESRPLSPAIQYIRKIAVYNWGKKKPEAALAYARSIGNDQRPGLIYRAIQGWASFEPLEAWNEIMQVSNYGANRKYYPEAVLREIAEKDMSLAIELYTQMQSSRACLECASSYVIRTAVSLGTLDSIPDSFHLLKEGPTRDRFIEVYWRNLGYFLKQEAFEKMGTHTVSIDQTVAETNILRGWARSDPDSCIEYAFTHFQGERLQEIVPYILNEWSKSDFLEDLSFFLNDIPDDYVLDTSITAIVDDMVVIDPQATVEWISTIENSEIKKQATKKAVWEWAKFSPEDAQDYVISIEDQEIQDLQVWYFLLSSLLNQTLENEHLDLIHLMKSNNIRSQLVTRLAVYMVDPSKNRSNAVDKQYFQEFVSKLDDLSAEDKSKVLEILEK